MVSSGDVNRGEVQDVGSSPEPRSPHRGRFTRELVSGCAVIGWLTGALSVALLWGQHRAGVLHPVALLFELLLAPSLLAALVGTAGGLWRVCRGPHRRAAAARALTCSLPLGLWTALAVYALRLAATGQSFPKNIFSDIAGMAVASSWKTSRT